MNTDPKNLPLTLTITKAAQVLGWSRGKLYNQVKLGRIRAHKMGPRVYILTEELIEDLKK